MPSAIGTSRRSTRGTVKVRQLHTLAELAEWRAEQAALNRSVAFVPTMGNLHAGHLRLVGQARQVAPTSTGSVLVSIFVNPLQFNDPADLARYPRTEEADCQQLAAAGVDAVFLPAVSEMYPDAGEAGTGLQTAVDPGALARIWEGAVRPGHFSGMATVVLKLFNLVQPSQALFGEKDFQQLQIIRRMVRDLNLPVAVVAVPTERAADGLALSSRNRFLTDAEREIAPRLYEALQRTAWQIQQAAEPISTLLEAARAALQADGFTVDYFVWCELDHLQPRQNAGPGVLLVAARLGAVRLLDNLRVAV